jgi:hypothetical protein
LEHRAHRAVSHHDAARKLATQEFGPAVHAQTVPRRPIVSRWLTARWVGLGTAEGDRASYAVGWHDVVSRQLMDEQRLGGSLE